MRNAKVWFFGTLLLTGAAWYVSPATAAVASQDTPAADRNSEQPLWEPPADEPEPRRPPAREDDREWRDPDGPPPPGARPGPPHRPPPHVEMIERLLPLIADRHPELAERLNEMRRRAPEEFERVLAEALAVRLEETLGVRDDRPRPPGPRMKGPRPYERELGERERERHTQEMALEREMGELHQRNDELEHRSQELAQRFRELREHGEPGLDREREEVRHEVERTVEQHFNVRTELREHELHRVEMELDRLREMLERIRHDLERREQARGAIIERRLRQLLGEDDEGW
jgi:hypothetical protein